MGQARYMEPTARWRCYADWAKRRPLPLRVADFLGRGRGRLRFLDDLIPPKRAALKPDLGGWGNHGLAAAWVGHATMLLRMDQWTILTDPVFSSRVGLGLGLMTGGPKRLVAPALSLGELPPIDLILVSHAHYDHLDRPTLVRLPKHIPVITSDRNSDLVRDLGFRKVTELRWGERIAHQGLTITAQRVRHWGARVFYDDYRGFNGFLIESSRHRVLYGGDSAYQDYFRDVGKVDLAVVGIGAYDPYVQAHATPEQALAMADHVRAEHVLPMHHSTYRLSREPMAEPLERLLTAVGKDEGRVVVREVGGMWSLNGNGVGGGDEEMGA
jgi:L-ascorbate metabolism protein UlaG (beta-lactamase superfamily)